MGEEAELKVLWRLKYQHTAPTLPEKAVVERGIVRLPALSQSLALDDSVTDHVKSVWNQITGEAEELFMKFDAREGLEYEDN